MKAACVAILLLGGWSLSVTAAAQDAPAGACPAPTPLTLTKDPQWIDHGVEVLFDPRRDYSVAQVTSAPLCRQFRPVPGMPAFGVERRGVWLRLRLPEQLADAAAWRLLVRSGAIGRLCAHWPLRAGGYQSECSDIDQPLGSDIRSHQGWNFRVPVERDPSRPLLLYAHGERHIEARMALGTADALSEYLYDRQTLVGAYCGVMLILVLFGLILFAAQRERSYWLFSAYLATALLYNSLQGGYLSSLGLVGRIVVYGEWPVAGVALLCATAFFQNFLDTRIHTPRLQRLVQVLMALFIFTVVVVPLVSPERAILLSTFLGGAWTGTLVAMMLLRLRQGSRAAAYSLLAFAPQALGGWLQADLPQGPGWVSAEASEILVVAGFLLNSGILAIGLVERMRSLVRERDQAKDLALSSQQLALHHAHYDPVTQLPNRARFRETLQERLVARVPGQRHALVTLGLDRFGLLNDALGHSIGDSVLGEIARRLQSGLGSETLLARTGADLFAWLDPAPATPAEIDRLRRHCESLQETVAMPLRLGSGARLSASIGIALCPDHAASAELLLQYSDAALHRAKLRGSGNLQIFDPGMHESASRHLELTKALHAALECGELVLHYQPIVSLKTGQLLGVESLVRWRRGDGQHVPPDLFVPLTQTGRLLRPFTEWGLRAFYTQLADWRTRGIGIPYASFNLTAQQLHLPDIEELILDLLDEAGAPPERVTLEVTEGTLLDNLEATAQLLGRFRQRGMAIAVDDFGVGYASPHYLRSLPVDILKLDGVFLRGVPQQAEANSVLDSLITLGQSLKLKIVSECVETEAQARYLAGRGVTGGQGFFFSRALPARELEHWLRARWRAVA